MGNKASSAPVVYVGSMQGLRETMEDEHVVLHSLPKHPDFGFYAVFDGHHGREAAAYCHVR